MNSAPDIQTTEAEASIFSFSSLVLTEDFNVTLTGNRYGGDASDEFTITRFRKPHPELLQALRRLTLHMCLLTENLTDTQLYPAPAGTVVDEDTYLPPAVASRNLLREAVESGEAYVHPLMENFRCTSVLWKTKGVVLKGGKRARYRSLGHSLKVETPTVDVRLNLGAEEEDLEEWEYPFFEQMHNALQELQLELVAFMNGKYGEGGEQLSLFGKPAPVELPESHPAAGLEALAQDLNMTITVSSAEDGHRSTRTFNGKALDDE